jgi:hypothetical protein
VIDTCLKIQVFLHPLNTLNTDLIMVDNFLISGEMCFDKKRKISFFFITMDVQANLHTF